MPSPEVRGLVGYAVLWAVAGVDAYGRMKVSAPEEIRVRWEGSRRVSSSPQDLVEATPAEAYVDREIEIGSIMWEGRLADWLGGQGGLFVVLGYEETPDFKGRNVQRTVTLGRFTETLPELV